MMNGGFDWDEHNTAHIARHGVTPEEAEEAVLNGPSDQEIALRQGETRRAAIGRTNAGRYLFLVTTWRGGRLRVVTAYPASKKHIERFRRARGESNDQHKG